MLTTTCDVERPAASPRFKLTWLLPLALGVALTVTVMPSLAVVEYSTSIGEFKHVTLEDGSSIQLNTSTRIRIKAGPQRTSVELVEGEVLLQLPRDRKGLLTIDARSEVTIEPGVRLDARKDEQGTSIAVLEGSATVKIVPSLKPAIPVPAGTEAHIATERAVMVKRRSLSALELMRRTAWTEGRLWFEGESLGEVVAQINRFNRRKLIVSDASIASISIGGVFRPTDLESFVRALAPLGIKAEQLGDLDTGTVDIKLVARTQ